MKQWKWRNGYRAKVSPDVAVRECERIRKEYGGELKPQRVVDESVDEQSPLHPAFEWDNEKAANEHRVTQARTMLASLVVVETVNDKPLQHRCYEVQRVERLQGQKEENVYKSVEDILADPEARKQLLRRAKAELAAFRKRYQNLSELATVIDAIDSVEMQLV